MTSDQTDIDKNELGRDCRLLLRRANRATLATIDEGKDPYASLVIIACRPNGTPILLLSNLAEHTKNLTLNSQVSLLIDGTQGLDDPLTGARVTIQGRIAKSEDTNDRRRFLNRHSSASVYADFADFSFYSVNLTRGHLVAGFGRIDWIDGNEILFDCAGCEELIEAESDILTHMNEDHADAVDLYAKQAGFEDGNGWEMTGIDPEGIDLRKGAKIVRVDFESVIFDAKDARLVLAGLAKQARRANF
ncbi:MAG TPA: heme iron utilization protein [Rhodospirillaceae bacterium]|nr:heme iron utilization protein [Rhodospirillaceae bacterium]HAA91027.1 heme iron utilization protein [Rhodospirillaceae bacterium]HAT34602.1 heme iron utilization protein [Rhodospirillaceae bacterium]|tara:strand:+ start:339 stop:1079 length:741 start_codon:yes stop_codon:yes gene_type:complete